jgi:hypothetical protein
MQNLDLEKVIIFLSLLLLPVTGFWVYSLRDGLREADEALSSAQKKDGMVQRIYAMQQLIDETKRELERQGGKATDATNYFRARMEGSYEKGSSLSLIVADLTVAEQPATTIRARRGQPGFEDVTVNLQWGRGGKMMLPRPFLNAYILNSESQSPIWKLRTLHLVNKEFAGSGGRTSAPKGEIADEWQVRKMSFARRKPLAKVDSQK